MSAPVAPSVMLPVYDEAENLPILWRELNDALSQLGQPAEVIFVDDGSTDRSAEGIRGLAARDARVHLVRFCTNAGLTAAFHAGFKAAGGRLIVTLDSDLQSDPRDIAALLARLDAVASALMCSPLIRGCTDSCRPCSGWPGTGWSRCP